MLLNQPGVHSEDYSKDGPTPHLQRRIKGEDKGIRSSHAVAEVRDEVDRAALEMILRKSCGADMVQVDAKGGCLLSRGNLLHSGDIALIASQLVRSKVLRDLAQRSSRLICLHRHRRARSGLRVCGRTVKFRVRAHFDDRGLMRQLDLWLSTLLESFPSSNYTVVYTTTPSAKTSDVSQEEPGVYQMDSTMSPLGHLELKRDLGARQQGSKNLTLVDGPLFERYQYFTPGRTYVVIPLLRER